MVLRHFDREARICCLYTQPMYMCNICDLKATGQKIQYTQVESRSATMSRHNFSRSLEISLSCFKNRSNYCYMIITYSSSKEAAVFLAIAVTLAFACICFLFSALACDAAPDARAQRANTFACIYCQPRSTNLS